MAAPWTRLSRNSRDVYLDALGRLLLPSPNHASSCPSGLAFPPLVSESFRRARWERLIFVASDHGGEEGSAHRLCRHLQLSAARCATDASRFAAGQWPWHSPLS